MKKFFFLVSLRLYSVFSHFGFIFSTFECLSISLVGTTVYDMGFVFIVSLPSVTVFLKVLLLDQKSYSRGIVIEFNNEEQSKAFYCAFEQWKKEAFVQGAVWNKNPCIMQVIHLHLHFKYINFLVFLANNQAKMVWPRFLKELSSSIYELYFVIKCGCSTLLVQCNY